MEEEQQGKDFQDYVVAIRKRYLAIVMIFLIIVSVSVSVAMLLPPIYRSSSTILIEQQEIPQELVRSTVTSYASERIQTIKARVMSRTNLLKIIDKFELYVDERKHETTEEIIGRMQNDVGLDIISADVVDPRTGRPSAATIAFSLSFKGEEPAKVQRVANELTSLYLNENITSRTEKASEALLFFEEEADRLGKQIDEYEKKLAAFKQKHSDALPELRSLNLNILQRTENELTALDSKIGVLEERKFFLTEQLSRIDPGNPDVPGSVDRLKSLKSLYASARSRYSDEHPDVVRLKNEIDILEQSTGIMPGAGSIAEELDRLYLELAQKRQKYTAEHPDIVSLQDKIEKLTKELETERASGLDEYYAEQPDNPLYIQIQSQVKGVEIELKSALEQRKKLYAKMEELEDALYKAPQVEREYLTLQRDYMNAARRYQETKAKQMQAQVAKQLESESKGEKFTLIDPAAYPEEPISPNRPAIISLGVILALASGLGFAVLADAISGTVRGKNAVKRAIGYGPLAVVPYQVSLQEETKSRRIKKRFVILFVAVIVAAILLIHFLVSPLDVMWFRILRKIDVFLA